MQPTTIPPGHTEREVTDLIEELVWRFAVKYRFPWYDPDDVASEGRLIAWKALQQYEPDRGKLECYLARSLANRMKNLVRDKYGKRADAPCKSCKRADEEGREPDHVNGEFCQRYRGWRERNQKRMLLNTSFDVCEQTQHAVIDEGCEDVETKDLLDYISSKLSPKQRELWLRFRNGEKGIDTSSRILLEDRIAAILDAAGLPELAERIIR